MRNVIYGIISIIAIGACSGLAYQDKNELLKSIFETEFEQKMISSGDNMPAFYLPIDSLDYFLIALHKNIAPGKFKDYLGWSDSTYQHNVEVLKQYDFLRERDGQLEPNVMIFTQAEADFMICETEQLIGETTILIKEKLPEIQTKVSEIDGFKGLSFSEVSLLILSDVVLDNWQIRNVEQEFIGADRPLRHGKNYYLSFQEKQSEHSEALGIYGNQLRSYGNYTVGLYGNKRGNRNFQTLSALEFASVFGLSEGQIQNLNETKAEYLQKYIKYVNDSLNLNAIERSGFASLGMLVEDESVVPILTEEEYAELFEVAEVVKQPLIESLNSFKPELRIMYDNSLYIDEISFEEYLIWWYHIFYTAVTDRLILEQGIEIPEAGNGMYIIKRD